MTYILGDSNRHPQSIEGRKIEQQTHYNRDTTLTVMTYILVIQIGIHRALKGGKLNNRHITTEIQP